MDVSRECLLYDKFMTRVYLADGLPEERTDIRLFIRDLKMEIVGEAVDWATALTQAPISQADLLLVNWDLISTEPNEALNDFKQACPSSLVIVLTKDLDARQQAALSAGANSIISKNETPELVRERLRIVAANVSIKSITRFKKEAIKTGAQLMD